MQSIIIISLLFNGVLIYYIYRNNKNRVDQKEKSLKKIVNTLPFPTYVKNDKGDFIMVNDKFCTLFDIEQREDTFNQKEIYDFSDDIQNKFVHEDMYVINENREYTRTESIYLDNRLKYFYTKKVPVTLGDKKRALGLSIDITDLDSMNNKFKNIISLSSELSDVFFNDENEFLKKVLTIALEITDEADYGSTFRFYGDKVKFIHAIGHDIDYLKKIFVNKDFFINKRDSVTIIDNILEKDKRDLDEEQSIDLLMKATKPIQSTLTFILNIEGEPKAGLSLDIKAGSQKKFLTSSVKVMNSFKTLVEGYYSIQEYTKLRGIYQEDLINVLTKLLEFHNKYTKGHSEEVAEMSKLIAQKMDFSEEIIDEIYLAGRIHDIGKTLIDKKILNKTTPLNDFEYNIIKKHPVYGFELLNQSQRMKNISKFIKYHHERYDGTGYPEGLKNEEIPIESKIISVADAWNAMRSDRAYRKALTYDEAIKELVNNKGKQFDPAVVDLFLDVIGGHDDV